MHLSATQSKGKENPRKECTHINSIGRRVNIITSRTTTVLSLFKAPRSSWLAKVSTPSTSVGVFIHGTRVLT
jgi:hypothetical protein